MMSRMNPRATAQTHPATTTENVDFVTVSSEGQQNQQGRNRQKHVIIDMPDADKDISKNRHREPLHVGTIQSEEKTDPRSYTSDDTMSIIWLDPNVHKGDDNLALQKQLNEVTKSLQVLANDEECEEYIRHLPIGEQVILIVPGSIGRFVIPLVHDLAQLNIIYIYAMEVERYRTKFKKYEKVKDFISNPNTLIEKIVKEQDAYRKVEDKELSVNIYNIKEALKTGNQSDDNKRFAWMYKFMNALLHLSESLPESIVAAEKQQLVQKLESIYSKNAECLQTITEFEESYSSNEAIQWYTRESIFYKELNRSLREKDLNLLLPFRFFIYDIYKQLLEEYKHAQNTRGTTDRGSQVFMAYRGQFMPPNAVMRMKNSINGYVSANSFLSTSLNMEIVLPFIKTEGKFQKELRPVLLEIEIDRSLETLPYAEVQKYSSYQGENEVLFSPGTILKIQSVIDNDTDDRICVVRLKLCNEHETRLDEVISLWKQNVESEANLGVFGRLILQTHQLDEVEHFYKMLLENLPEGNSLIRDCWNGLGNVHLEKGQWESAINFHRHAIAVSEQMNDHQKWAAKGYSDLANVYIANSNTKSALKYYKKALEKFEAMHSKAHLDTAMCYSKIGTIYQNRNDHNKSLESFKKALELIEDIDLKDPHELITILKSMSQSHYLNSQFLDALKYTQRALTISRNYLRTNHPNIGSLYEDIGDIYLECDELILALSSYHRAAEIYDYSFSQEDKHNLEIQCVIKCCNSKLKQNNNAIKQYPKNMPVNSHQPMSGSSQSPHSHPQSQPLTTTSINDKNNEPEHILPDKHDPSKTEHIEHPISTNVKTASARSHRDRKKRN